MSYTLALGPLEAAWRGPQRLILSVERERVIDCDYRDMYNERGYAEQLSHLDLEAALDLIARMCDTCSQAHLLAFCTALESLVDIKVPQRAAALRTVVAELERLTSHLEAVQYVCTALGLPQRRATFEALHEQAYGAMQLVIGKTAPPFCLLGGVRSDIGHEQRAQLIVLLRQMNRQLYRTGSEMIDQRSIFERSADIGALSPTAAESFGVRGPLARASGLNADMRWDEPYAFYGSLERHPIVQDGGDVYARMLVLLLEAVESIKLVERTLEQLPEGDWQGSELTSLPPGVASAGVESPRGLLRYTLHSDGQRLTSIQIDTPRQIDRLLARTLFIGALVDDVPLIMSSLDVCVACAEL